MGLLNSLDYMVEFRLKGPMHRAPTKGFAPGEKVMMRVRSILCLFPEHHQIRTIESGWTIEVYEEDWPIVEKAFRNAFLGNKVTAQ